MSRNVVAQQWPVAGGGNLTLVLSTPEPDADAITRLAPVVGAIDSYRAALAAAKVPTLGIAAQRVRVGDFAGRIADYMAERTVPWANAEGMRAAATEAVRLVFEDAFFETWELAKAQHRRTHVGECEERHG